MTAKLLFVVSFLFVAFLSAGCQNARVVGPRVYGPPPAPEAYTGSARDMGPTRFRLLGVSGSVSGDTVTITNRTHETIAVDSGFYDELFYIAPNGSFVVDLAKTLSSSPNGYAILTFYRYGPNREPIVIATERFGLSGRGAYIRQHICTIDSQNDRIVVWRK